MARPKLPAATSATKGYANGKRRTNLSIHGTLADIAAQYFPTTRHASLSGFLENMLRREYRANSPKLRKLGVKVPVEIFAK